MMPLPAVSFGKFFRIFYYAVRQARSTSALSGLENSANLFSYVQVENFPFAAILCFQNLQIHGFFILVI